MWIKLSWNWYYCDRNGISLSELLETWVKSKGVRRVNKKNHSSIFKIEKGEIPTGVEILLKIDEALNA